MVGNRREEYGKNIITGVKHHNRVLLRFNYTGLLFNLPLNASIRLERVPVSGSCGRSEQSLPSEVHITSHGGDQMNLSRFD